MDIKVGKSYTTRGGGSGRIYSIDGGGLYMIHGAIEDSNGWFPYSWKKDGTGQTTEYDLSSSSKEVCYRWQFGDDKSISNEVFETLDEINDAYSYCSGHAIKFVEE